MVHLAVSFVTLLMFLAGCADTNSAPPKDDVPDAPVIDAFALEFTSTGSVTGTGASTTPATPEGCSTVNDEGFDIVHHPWEIPAAVNGTAVALASMSVTLHILDQALLDADIYLEAPDGTVLGSGTAFNAQTGPDETVNVSDGLVSGTYNIVIRGCTGQGDYAVSGQAELRPVPQAVATEAPSWA